MSDAKKVKFSLNVMMNKEKTKVLFAEVDSDFADVLLSFLTLPLGTIVALLQNHYRKEAPVFGSLTTLYNSLADLDDVHFWTEAGKLMLLNPRSAFQDVCSKLKVNIDDTQTTKYIFCGNEVCSTGDISMNYGTATCTGCGERMDSEMHIETDTQAAYADGVFTNKRVSFVISDDLRLVPNDARSFIQTLCNLGITDAYGAKQRAMNFGLDEIMDLLKGSLLSRTPLTDLILHKNHRDSAPLKSEPGALLCQIMKKETSKSDKKMKIKFMVQKSTSKFLFAQAEEDFVDFLFSFLTIPLAGAESLLGSNSCLKNIDNLHRSSANLNNYLKTTKNNLFNPELPPMYLSKNNIFSLSEQSIPELHYSWLKTCLFSHKIIFNGQQPLNIIDPKGQGSYVRGPGTYMVTDDLTVTPWCLSSSFSVLNGMKIQISDVKEVDIDIGLEEALSILKASLTSNRALTNGLSSIINDQSRNSDLDRFIQFLNSTRCIQVT